MPITATARPICRAGCPAIPPPRMLAAKREVVKRAAWRNIVVNTMIAVAILLFAMVGAYFIVSSL